MKKIVALVLSLVMVLGLATTAMAAPASTSKDLGDFYFDSTTDTYGPEFAIQYGLNAYAANSPKDVAVAGVKDGLITAGEEGNVAYFTLSTGDFEHTDSKFVQVATVGEADFTVYYPTAAGTEASKSVFMYLAKLDSNPVYAGTATLFANFGENCGQYDFDPAEDTKYYMFQGSVYKVVAAGNDDVSLMIDGALTSVEEVASVADIVGHVAKFTYDAKYKITAVECAECGVAAVIYPNYDSVPKAEKAAFNVYGPINTDDYYCWTKAPAAPAADAETDKVESAQTFDAGIAMYVGMSVMAAAGSAVVLKKKD